MSRAARVNVWSRPPWLGRVTHRLWKTLWTACGGPAVCCGSQLVGHNQVTMADRSDGRREAYDGGPVGALRRIAFLLERSRAETYKVKAFRAAADTILPLGRRGRRAGRGRARCASCRASAPPPPR